MEVDQVSMNNSGTQKFSDLDILYRRKGYFAQEIFEPSNELLDAISEGAKVLVIGAGGLGCEILKDLALSGI
jgi:ubiquitin-activating enzyme E1 C